MAKSSRTERLYLKALNIREGLANGFWLPVMRHLALRRVPEAMIEVGDWYSSTDPRYAFGLYRGAFRQGDSLAAQHLAIECFNRNDLTGYRLWLRRAANAGDTDAATQLRAFETRLPHDTARKIGRGRPFRRTERS